MLIILGTVKQVSQISVIKQQDNTLESDKKENGEESDEAKESEADPETISPSSTTCQHNNKSSESESPRLATTTKLSSAKASQTEPLRRFSIDVADSTQCSLLHKKLESAADSAIVEEMSLGGGGSGGGRQVGQEPRRRSNSASHTSSQVASYQCNLCQISLNSQSQVAQVKE